ncbi:MAG: hypothetical protein JNL75_01335 [Chitinophagales bacterium]|nr:hypothetical protein [Chitinophagales bacterium]
MRLILFAIISFSFYSLHSQRYLGNHIGGYSGVYGIQENPASFVTKKPNWDINVLGTGLYFYTEYGYLQDESLISAAGKTIRNGMDTLPFDYDKNSNSLFFANTYDQTLTGLMFQQTIHLPSFCFKVKRFSFGAFSNIKIAADGLNAPNFFNYNNLQNIIDFNPYKVTPFSVNAMAWGEIGLHIGYALELENGHTLAVGANPKYLIGFESFYVQNKSDYNFFRERDTFFASTANASIGFATGASRTTNNYNFGIQGTGLGLDLGAEYMIPNEDEESNSTHYMKFGIAIKDLGSIRFDKNTEQHNFSIKDADFNVLTTIHNNLNHNYDLIKRLSAAVYQGDSLKSKVDNEMTVHTPTSINISWDYNIRSDFYIHAFIGRRLKTLERQIAAPNVMAVGARYEKRWFEAGANISLTEDKWMGIGTYVRLGLLTIGSDHINALLFSQPKLRGADVYLSLKVMPFGNREKEDGIDYVRTKKDRRSGCYNQ